jgi:pimeloyl-ACP methyl ester carboxylesterase
MARATIADLQLEYRLQGPPAGDTIVLMTGSATPLVQWEDALVGALTGAGYQVLSFDYRDAGRSTHLDNPVPDSMPEMMAALAAGRLRPIYTVPDLAGDVLGLLDAVGIRAAHLFGLSLGGMIGHILAARNAERVLSLVTLSSTTSDPTLPLPSPEMLKDLTRPLPSTRQEYVTWHADVFGVTASRSRPPSRAWLEARAARVWDYCGFDRQAYLRHLLAAIGAEDRTPLLKSVRAPAMIMQGTEDPVHSIAAAEAQARAIPGAQLRLVEGMGHDILAEHVPDVTDLYLSFLGVRDPGRVPPPPR